MFFYLIVFGIAVFAIVVLGLIVSNLYKRAPKDKAFVRTGVGGMKVVKDGGAFIIPVLHETVDVNMSTLRLDVHRSGVDALLTKDKMRVDVEASFYTKVGSDAVAIGTAAQTLGKSTMNPDALKNMVENKFVDALRSVAATMTMGDLNEKRSDFSAAVQDAISHDLVKNGLELENVSITRLDQTDIKHLNENNVFDAEGLANITKITQEKAKERNDVRQATRILIEQRDADTNKQSLAIRQANQFAELDQQREVDTRRFEQESQLSKQKAERQREADVATIEAEQATALARQMAEQRMKEVTIKQNQDIRLAEQVAQIAVNEKSEAESVARSSADKARAVAVTAAQEVITAESVAKAEREKRVAIIAAEQEASRTATGITVQAKAEFDAAELRAKARVIAADALDKENTVKAAGERAFAEAANSLSSEQVNMRLRTALISALPQIVENMVAPMKAVKNARVVSITGLGGNGTVTAGNAAGGGGANLPNQLTNAMLDYKLQSPLVEMLAKEIGVDLNGGLNGLVNADALGINSEEGDKPTVARNVTETKPLTEAEVAEMQRLAGITSNRRSNNIVE